MSSQTVVDVIVSGSTATVVDKRVDGVTTVAGAAPVTNVSGQVPDLGVNTDILATQGDILSLTNDVASLRANLIITGTNLTDEIGLLSGTLISTGNQLNFTINTLSGELIATGNSLDSFRNVLSGNLISTGIRLQDQLNVNTDLIADLRQATGDLNRDKLDKAGGTISGNILPSASGTINFGSVELPFLSGHFKDLIVSNNTLFIGDVPIHSANGGIDFLSATGETFFKDVTIRNLTVTGTETIIDVDHLAVKDNTITLNSGEDGAGISLITGGIIIDRGSLPDADILFNEENDRFEFNFPVAIQGSPVITKGVTGSFVTQGQLDATGINLQNQIISNDTDISNTVSNLSTTGSTLSNKISTFSGQVELDFLATGSSIDSLSGNLIATGNTLESSINSITSNVNTTGQTLQTQITTNAGSITSLDSAVKATGVLLQNQITDNDSEINTLTSNLSSTGQTLQVQIIENDNDLSDISGKLGETGLFLSNEIAIVSGVAGGDRFNQLSGNLITTGQYLTSEIAIVSGMTTGGAAVDVLSGHLVSTGQYLTSEVSTVSGLITNNDNEISALLAATGELKTDIAGNATNMGVTGQFLQNQINGNDNDIANLNTRLISTGNHLVDVTNLNTSDIRVVSGLVVSNDGDISNLQSATGQLKNLSDSNSVNLISTGGFLTSEISIVSGIAGGQDLTALSGKVNVLSGNVIVTGQTLQTQILSNDSEISSIASNLITTGQYLTEEIAIVSGLTTGSSSDPALSGKVDTLSGNLITTGQTLTTNINTVSSNLIATGKTLTDNVNTVSSNLVSTGSRIDDISGNLITTGQTLQTQITSNDSDISTLTSNLGVTGQTLQTQITSNDSDISTVTSNLATTGQTLQTQITSNDSDISTLTSNLVTTGQTLTSEIAIVSGIAENASDEALSGKVDTLSGNLITTGQTLQTQITSNDSDITSLTSNLVTTGQTLTTDITTVSGLIVDNDGDITALKTATGVLKTSTDSNAANLITTGQTLQTQITSNDGDISTLTTNLGTTGQTLQTQINSNDSDISTLTSNLITTGQTLTTDISAVSGLITDNDADITALKSATGVLKTSTDANTTNLITTGQTLQTQITSNDGDITTLTSNLVTTGQTLQTQITSNDSDISTLTTNIGTTGQTLQTQITSNDSDISTLTSNLVTTGQTLTTNINTVATNLGTSGQTLQTQITSNDSDISTLTSNLGTTGQTLQTQITSNDTDIASLTTNLGTTGQTLQTQITSNDSDISTLDSTTVKLTTNQSIAGNKIFTNDVTINNLTVTGTEVVVDVENLAVKDNIIEINSGESGAGISRISGGIVIDRGTATNANILYNDANDRFELNFPLAVEGEVVASASNLITTGQTLTTNINTVSTNLGTSGQTLQTQITSNDNDISTLTTNLGTTGQTLQTQITSNDSDISTLTTNLGTTGQTLQTQITSNDSDISTLTSNLVTTGQTLQTQITSNDSDISTLTTNLGTTGQTLQTQITSNDSDISTLTSNLVTTGQTLTTNINTVSTNLGTSGQTLQTQITSNDTDITNLSSNLVTTGQTLTTNINTVATNLVTTGQTLTSEIATVSGLIPATVIDGGGTANKVPLWSDGNTIGDSVISQSSSKIGIGTGSPSNLLHLSSSSPAIKFEDTDNTDDAFSIIEDNNGNLKLRADASNVSANTELGLEVDGSRVMTLAGASVGIGTNAPTEPLHVESTAADILINSTTANQATRIRLKTTSHEYRIGTQGTVDNFWIYDASNSAYRMVISPAGAVGINTTSPNASSKLHVYGWTIIQSATNFASLRLQSTTGSWDIDNNNGTFGLQWAGGDKFNITSAGSVGIGTNSPVARLHVHETTAGRIQLTNGTSNATASDGLAIAAELSTRAYFWLYENAYMQFATNNAERMRIAADGKVGIGTNAPGVRFHLVGAAGTVNSLATSVTAATMRIQHNSASSLSIFSGNTASSETYFQAANYNGTTAYVIALNPYGGSVGIGTNAPADHLQVKGSGSQSLRLTSTSSHASIRVDRYNTSSDANFIIQTGGVNKWRLATGLGGNDEKLTIYDDIADVNMMSFKTAVGVGVGPSFGTREPEAPLHILGGYDANNPKTLIIAGREDSSTVYGGIQFEQAGGNTFFGIGNDSRADRDEILIGGGFGSATNATALRVFTGTYDSSVGTERLTILSSGSVGIGTNNPGYKLDVNGTAHITTAQDSVAPLTLKSTYNGSTAGPLLDLYRKSGTPSDGDNLGTITFTADTNVGSINEFARIESTALDVTDTTEDGALKLAVVTAGTLRSRVYMDSTETVFNDASQDFDFRVESDNSVNALFVQGSSGNLGIGTGNPPHKLSIYGTGAGKATVQIEGEGGADPYINFLVNNTTHWAVGADDSASDSFKISQHSALGTNDRITVLSGGNVGIGTNAPVTKLDIWGGTGTRPTDPFGGQNQLFISQGSTTNAGITISADNNGGTQICTFIQSNTSVSAALIGTQSNHGARIRTNNTDRITILSGGSVGIGVADPDQSLEVAGAIKSTGAYGFYAGRGDTTWASFGSGVPTILLRGSLDNSRAGAVQFKEYDGTDTAAIYSTDGTDGYGLVMAAYQGDMKFSTGSLQGYKMVILGGGSVGIGTASPDNFVHIREGGLAGRSASNSNTSLTIEHHANTGIQFFSGTQTQIRFGDAASTAAGAIIYEHSGDNFKLNFTDHLTINGSGGEKVRVKNDGNVGIGVSPTTRLHVLYPAVGQSGSAVTSITKTQATNLGVKLSFSGGANSTNNIIGGISLGNNGEEYAGLYAIDGGSSAATDLAFFVGDTNGINEAVHIDSGGTVQINSPASSGTRSLTVKLTDNTSGAAVFEQSSNEYLRINTTNGSEKIILGDNGTNPKINFNGEYDFPTADGSAGQVLTTDGSGTLSFSSAGSGTVSGSGTDNYIPRWNGTTALENSAIYDNGSNRISLGTVNTSPWQALHVQSTGSQFSDGASGNSNYNVVVLDQNAYTSNYGGGILFGGKYNNAGNITTLAMVSASKVNGDGNFGGKVHIGGREHGTSNVPKVLTVTHASVGIGTVTPAALLHVDGIAIIDDLRFDSLSSHFIKNDGNLLRIAGDNGVKFQSYDGGWQTRMTIVDDGNVGIGTISPDNPLEVFGADSGIKISSASNNRPHLRLECGTAEKLRLSANTVYGAIGDSSDTNRYMVFKDGNIGIGQADPKAELHIGGSFSDAANDLATAALAIKQTSTSAENGIYIERTGERKGYYIGIAGVDGLTFRRNFSGTKSDIMSLTREGNVGIGTNAPDGRLHVYTGSAGSTTPNTNHDDLTIESSGNAGLQLFTPDANYQYIAFGSPAGANRGYVRYGHNEEEMVLRAATVDILKIKSTGVGIGTTPNSSAKLESYITSGGEKGLRLNSNFSGGNAVDFIPAVVGVSNAGFSIDLAGTTRFVINDGGNVGIGTNSSNAHLKVQSASGTDVLVRINTGGTETDSRLMLGEADAYGMTFEYDGVSNIGYLGMNDNVQPTGSWSKRIQMSRAGTEVAFMAGNVGIGSASPGGKLHVYGGTTAFTNLSDNTDSVQITRNASVHTHQDAKLFIYDNSNADWAQKIELGTASYGLRIGGWTDYGVAVYQNTKGLVFSARTNETVINDGAADYDFRVEGDTDDYLLFTEGSTDRVAISTTAPAAKLHVEGDFKVGTTNNGNWMGYKDVSLNGNTYTTALTINLNNHTGCYVKLFLSGDWSSHSAVAFVGEYFIQNGSDGYAEPGTVISEFDNTNTDSIESKIVDPSSDTFTIQLKLSTAANGTLGGKLSYHVMGMATAVS